MGAPRSLFPSCFFTPSVLNYLVFSIYRGIDTEEFKKVMQSMRSHTRQGVQHRDGRRTGLKGKASVENGGLVEYLFGKDGKGRLSHDKFVQFIRDLHDEVCL